MNLHRLLVRHAACALLSFGCLAPPALAQGIPQGPIRFVYPYGPGSGVEGVWRALATAASKELGQNIVVENKPGAAGRNGMLSMATAPKNGSVISMGTNIELVTHVLADPAFKADAGRDFEPVLLLFKNFQVWYAHPSVPFRDVKGLVAYARTNPGKLNFGTAGNGTPGHLGLELLKTMTGTDIVLVPYKGGAAAISALLAQDTHLVSTDTSARSHVDAGKLVAIGTTADRRHKPFLDTATFAETLAGFEVSTWYGLIAPAGTPAEVITRLRQAYLAALKSPEVQARLEALGMQAIEGGPKEFEALLAADRAKWKPVIDKAGLKFN